MNLKLSHKNSSVIISYFLELFVNIIWYMAYIGNEFSLLNSMKLINILTLWQNLLYTIRVIQSKVTTTGLKIPLCALINLNKQYLNDTICQYLQHFWHKKG